jgi:hypothetical protein
MARAALIAFLPFEVKTLAANPYSVLFATAIASSKDLTVITERRGPKISSCAILESGST